MSRRRKPLPHEEAASSDRWTTVLLAAFVALVVARTFLPEDPGGKLGHGATLDALWIVLSGAWLMGQFRHELIKVRFGWPDALMVALIGWYVLSAIVAIWNGSPRPAMNVLWDWIAMGLVFLLARQLLDKERDTRAVVVVMIGLACGMSAAALHQYFESMPADIAAYQAANGSTETLFQETGQWLEPGTSERIRFEARLSSRLPSAGYAPSNSLASFLVTWLIMLVGVVFVYPLASRLIKWQQALATAISGLMIACIWLTGSRTAGVASIVGLLPAISSAGVLKSTRKRWAAAIAGLVLILAMVAVVLAGTSIGQKALDAAWRSVAFRVEYWRATAAIIADFPLLTVARASFKIRTPRTSWREPQKRFRIRIIGCSKFGPRPACPRRSCLCRSLV